MAFNASKRKVLLLHDGELADVRTLLEGMGIRAWESLSGEAPSDWDLAVATPRYLQAASSVMGVARFRRVAVLDSDSRTLRTLIRKAGVDLVVRRPVHRSALRLLLLYALYRGPERRKPRVAVGAPVNYWIGLQREEGILSELSLDGCRLLPREDLEIGQRVLISIPDPEPKKSAVKVLGKVVRMQQDIDHPGADAYGIRFGWLTRGTRKRLEEAFEIYEKGPAMLPRTMPVQVQNDPNEDTADSCGIDPNRRGTPRIPFPHRVVAHDQDATRILIGRDLSVGGMLVDTHPELTIGKTLRIAVHLNDGSATVRARVLRDDGSRGVALRFVDVTKGDEELLLKMIHGSPRVEEAGDLGEEEIVLTEIILDDEVGPDE